MSEQKIRVSQSIIKALDRYTQDKECGLVIEKQYVKGEKIPASDVQALGNWLSMNAQVLYHLTTHKSLNLKF